MKRLLGLALMLMGAASAQATPPAPVALPSATLYVACQNYACLQAAGVAWFNQYLLLAEPSGYTPGYTVVPTGWINWYGTPVQYPQGTTLLISSTTYPVSTYMTATSGPPKGGYVQGFNYGNANSDKLAWQLDADLFGRSNPPHHEVLANITLFGSGINDLNTWTNNNLDVTGPHSGLLTWLPGFGGIFWTTVLPADGSAPFQVYENDPISITTSDMGTFTATWNHITGWSVSPGSPTTWDGFHLVRDANGKYKIITPKTTKLKVAPDTIPGNAGMTKSEIQPGFIPGGTGYIDTCPPGLDCVDTSAQVIAQF